MSLNPLPLLSSLATTAGSFLGGIQTYLIVGAVTLALGLAGGAYGGYRWELGTYEKQVAYDAQAQTKAVELAQKMDTADAQVAQDDAVAEQARIDKATLTTTTIQTEITRYVHDKISCPGPTVGLARLLYAAASRQDPAALTLAAGQSDDACSDVSATEVAGWFTSYADTAGKNADQLNALIADVQASHAIAAQVQP